VSKWLSYEEDQPAGQRLAPEVREEIKLVAPSTIAPGSVTDTDLADEAITTPKIHDGAVTDTKIANGAVKSAHLGAAAVTSSALANGAVTASKAGTGVVTGYDDDGNPITVKLVPMAATDYDPGTADPDTIYFLY